LFSASHFDARRRKPLVVIGLKVDDRDFMEILRQRRRPADAYWVSGSAERSYASPITASQQEDYETPGDRRMAARHAEIAALSY
jgi:hypothetical protein